MPEPVGRIEGAAARLPHDDIDTDIIIPSREMKTTGRTGLAAGLFANWRYTDPVALTENPAFVLNQPAYRAAPILVTGANFGCGSSREHAVWALREWGVRAIVAQSFNPIFFGNSIRNGLVPVVLAREAIATLPARLAIDLETMTADAHAFALPADARQMLMQGLDPIALTLRHQAAIAAWRARDRRARRWAWLKPA